MAGDFGENNSLLPFYRRSDDKKASDDEVKIEYSVISQMEKGKSEKYYEQFTKLYVQKDGIVPLAAQDVQTHVSEIEAVLGFDEFSTYPASVQLAMADMNFNMGSTNFRAGFSKFFNAIKHRDWETAADESSRKDVGAKRNKDTKDNLISAVGNPPFFISVNAERRVMKHQYQANGNTILLNKGDDKTP